MGHAYIAGPEIFGPGILFAFLYCAPTELFGPTAYAAICAVALGFGLIRARVIRSTVFPT